MDIAKLPTLGVALIGCGTVGSGVARLLLEQSRRLSERTGRVLDMRHVVVRNPQKPRPVTLPRNVLTTDIGRVCNDPDVRIAVELIGGVEPARKIILDLLASGKDVVTANKAVLALHGSEIFAAAHRHGRTLAFEASVAGGIPIIAALGQGLAANQVQSIKAILNGTSNFILSQMTDHGESYANALKEAQARGYAEADPTVDVNGTDSAHKLAILARLAFGVDVLIDAIDLRGIDTVQPADVRFAGELGYVVKLIAEAWTDDHRVALHVEPTLVRRFDPLAEVRGAYNAIHVVGDVVGDTLYYGQGAGGQPTASAVLADVMDLAVGRAQLTFRTLRLWEINERISLCGADDIKSRFYLRVNVEDRPGVIAEVAGILGRQQISIASVMQHEALEEHTGLSVPVVIMTHNTNLGTFRRAVAEINRLGSVTSPSTYFPVAE
jgi:homoserine dehydrogenase